MNDKPRGVVHEYWLERRRASEVASEQAHKPIDKPIDLWDKVI